ncbi:MAG: hypothetical protein EON55_07180 [Alphaproteobacteria bacterium]|nr:MAG: hypothetical protein EON55_07180 [Alphaproteobacteria bacterium]
MSPTLKFTSPILVSTGRLVTSAKLGLASASMMVLASPVFAATTSGIGSRLQEASTDLGTGGGYVLQLMGYLLGAAAILAGFYTIWQYTKNPNGQNKLGYGIAGVILGGAFLSASLWGSFASNTVSGGAVSNTGAAAQMTFQ